MTRESELQLLSDRYWTSAQTTYLASADYYDAQEAALRLILRRLEPIRSVGDIGCGDGRFTMVALDHASSVHGFDIGPALIRQARERADGVSSGRASFTLGSFDDLSSHGPFDVVMCLGVLSAMLEPDRYADALSKLKSATRKGGTLITKDTLTSGEQIFSQQGSYVATYRNLQNYLDDFAMSGFSLVSATELSSSAPTSNSIYVFSATDSPS